VDEQFYLVFPLLFFVWLRGHARWPWSRALLPAATLVSLAWPGLPGRRRRHRPLRSTCCRRGSGNWWRAHSSPADCQDFIEDSLSNIDSEARPGDIVWLAALRMPELRGLDWQRQDAQQIYRRLLAERTPVRAQAAREEADRLLGRLQRLGVHVIIDAPLPLFKAGAYRCSDWFNRSNPTCAGGLAMLPLLCGPDRCAAF